MRGLGTVLWKDIRLFYREPEAAVLLIIMPLIIIVFVSYAFEGLVTGDPRLDLPVVDLDETPASRELVDNLGEVVNVKEQRWRRDTFAREDAASLFDGGRRVAVLVIPKGFEGRRGRNEPSPLQLYVDPAQRGLASVLRLTVQSRLQAAQFVETAVAIAADESGRRLEDVEGRVRGRLAAALAEPDVPIDEEGVVEGKSLPSAFEQTVPGFTLMFSLFLASAVSVQISLERRTFGTWYRTLASPVRRPVVVLGIVLAVFSLGVAQTVLLFTIGRLAFGMELGTEYAGLAATIVLFQMAPAGFGLLIAGWTDNIPLQQNIVNPAVMLLAVLGGAMVPLFLLPNWMQIFSQFTPHYWAMQSLHDLMFRGRDLADVAPKLGILSLFGVIPLGIGLLRFQMQRYL